MATFGLLLGNRDFFPSRLCQFARKDMLYALKKSGHKVICLSEEDSPYGAIENYEHAGKCAEIFRRNREAIEGLIISLPNFGDERSIADAIRLSDLKVPVLVHAFPDVSGEMSPQSRRDSFCGKISVCNCLKQYGIKYSLTKNHTLDPLSGEFSRELSRFEGVCRIVKGLKNVRLGGHWNKA